MTSDPERNPRDHTFGTRLKAARKRAGLSLGELSARIGGIVTRQALSKYEKSRMLPSPEVLELLEKILDIRSAESQIFLEQPAATESMRFLADGVEPVQIREEIHCLACHDEKPPALFRVARKSMVSNLASVFRGEKRELKEGEPVLQRAAEPGFATLAERRTCYSRAWESAAGPERIRFREGEKLPAKSASTLKHRVADHLDRYLSLESLLGMPVAFENPVAAMAVRTTTDIEAAAAEVRRRWELGSGPVVNLLGVLEDRGIRVFETAGIDGFEGLSGTFGAVPFLAVSRDFPVDRRRFTAAHELGHVLCRFPEREGAEGMCHGFAGAFLLPKAAVEKAFGGPGRKITLGELSEIKSTFGISLQAIMARARNLGLVSERQFRGFRETVKVKSWAVTEPAEYRGVERATRFRRLVHYAVAADILDLDRAARLTGIPAAKLRDEMGEIF